MCMQVRFFFFFRACFYANGLLHRNCGLEFQFSSTSITGKHWRWMAAILSRLHCVNHHDDVIKWKHFPRYWPFVRRIHRSPVNSSHKGQWRGALMFSLICVWINNWINNGEAGDLRRYRIHYDVTVMDNLLCCRHNILKSARARQSLDGLNNVNYTLVDYQELPLYTYVVVRVNIPDAVTYLRTIGYS